MSTTIEPDTTVQDLFSEYNDTKSNASKSVSKLTDSFTLEGMDTINEMVSDAMSQIRAFTENGAQKSTTSKMTSKALSIIDPNNSWAGKWLNNASDNIETEKLKEKSINEVIETLVHQIELKRDEVIEFIQAAMEIKEQMITSLATYQTMLDKATTILSTAKENTKEAFDAEYLSTMLRTTIEGIKTDIKSQVDPLIGGAKISVTQITSILPTIENDLKYKSGFKAFQQKLSDLNGMVKTTTELAANAGDVIRRDVNETIYQSLEMLGETGLDTKRLEKIHKEELAHQAKINDVMNKTQTKMKQTFNDIKALSHDLQSSRQDSTNALLESYTKVD